MNPSRSSTEAVERYLRRLRTALAALDEEERDAILDELRSHLSDRLREGEGAARRALDAFGDPETFARSFVESADLRAALARNSMREMFVHLLRSAGRGGRAFLTAALVLLLGVSAVTFGVMAVLKPLLPDLVGFWTRPETGEFVFGIASRSGREGAREVLGYWLIPIALAASLLSLVAASHLQRHALTGHLRSIERTPGPGEGPDR